MAQQCTPSLFDKKRDYPGLQQTASRRSDSLKRWHFLILQLYLLLLLLLALGIAISPGSRGLIFLWIGASLLIALSLFIGLDKRWYEMRRLAESYKTLYWRWVMGAEPFQQDPDAVELFKRFKSLQKNAPSMVAGPKQPGVLSVDSEALRKLEWQQRRKIYLEHRAKDQVCYYTKNSIHSNRTYWWLAAVLILAHLLTLVLLLLGESSRMVLFNLFSSSTAASLLITLIGCWLAWMQARRYREFALNYGSTAEGLKLTKEELERAQKESAFLALVDEFEEQLSREHAAWVQRGPATGV